MEKLYGNLIAKNNKKNKIKWKRKERCLTSNSLLRLIVLSLSVSDGGDSDVLDAACCGTQDGVDDGGAMLADGTSGLEGVFQLQRRKNQQC